MNIYINKKHFIFSLTNSKSAYVSFLIKKDFLEEISSILKEISRFSKVELPSIIFSEGSSDSDKFYELEMESYSIYTDVYRFDGLFELKIFGEKKNITSTKKRDFKIEVLLNN